MRRLSANSRSGMIGCSARARGRPGRPAPRRPAARSRSTSGIGPAALGRLDDPEDQRADSERRADRADQVEAPGLSGGLRAGSAAPARSSRSPIGTLMKNPARHEIHCAAAPPTTRPRLAPIPAVARVPGHGTRALRPLREARGQQRQRRRRHDRGTDALQGACADQPRTRSARRRSGATRQRTRRARRRTPGADPAGRRAGHPAAAAHRRPACRRPAPRTGRRRQAHRRAMLGSPVKITELSSRIMK